MLHQMIVLTVGATDGDAVGFLVGDYFLEKIR
jgi:membrane protein DedA with SNARE-associated domain